MTEDRESIYSLGLEDLRDELVSNSFAKYGADQIFSWIYKKKEFDTDNWSNTSGKARTHLYEKYDFFIPKVIWDGKSKDGTRKFLLELRDGKRIEVVTIPAKDRLTICISSQVGCAIGCTFCRTGENGFVRNLAVGEITGQYLSISKWLEGNSKGEEISNIVYMGQGEPLHNFDNVKKSLEIFLEPKGVCLGQRKITLSTSGLAPQIEKLMNFPPINIAISLHAANDDIRDELMPINKKYDLKRLFEAISKIPLKAHRRITYEYLLVEGLNDRMEDVLDLTKLLKKKESKINLIPFNEYPGSKFKRPSDDKVVWFQNEILKRDYVCTVRMSKGDDILAACGQLVHHKS